VTLVRSLHLLAMAFFVGGQLFLVAAVVPSLRGEDDRERLRAIARRFGWGTLAAIVILVGTGIPLASHFHQWESGTLHVKLASLPPLPDWSSGTCAALSCTHSRARSSSGLSRSCGSASRSRTSRRPARLLRDGPLRLAQCGSDAVGSHSQLRVVQSANGQTRYDDCPRCSCMVAVERAAELLGAACVAFGERMAIGPHGAAGRLG
jgi:hypothetical protein